MKNLCDINVIKDVMTRHGFNFSKALGQNFIVNPSVCPRIAEMGGVDENTGVIEIGAGVGVLTAELAKRAKKVVCIEIDSRLLPVLDETLADFDNIEIVNEDVLKLDLHALLQEKFAGCKRVSVCANLPYYITSPVVMKLLEERLPLSQIVVMVQKEAAERLCAEVGTREAGAVTAAVQYYATAETLFGVGRECFVPSPNVDSAVIRLSVRETPEFQIDDEKFFFKMVKAAFAQRRKTAQNGISAGLGLPKEQVAAALEAVGLPQNVRAEKIPMETLSALSNILLSHQSE